MEELVRNLRMRANLIQSQQKNSLKKLEESGHKYKCNKCRDLTFIVDDGVAYECECRALRLCEDILKRSGISEGFREKTFDNFDYAYNTQITIAYKKAALYEKSFIENEKGRYNSIMFLGQVGSGKTHLSLAIANSLMESGVGVLYMSYRECVTKLKQNILDEAYYRKEMDRLKMARVLLIDDLYKGNISKSDINIMFEIINHRYFNNKAMIISSEKSIDEILNIDEAIGSRLVEMSKSCVVSLEGLGLNYRL